MLPMQPTEAHMEDRSRVTNSILECLEESLGMFENYFLLTSIIAMSKPHMIFI